MIGYAYRQLSKSRPAQPDAYTEVLPFNRNNPKLIFTKHARCRMECRQIDEAEIKELLKKGKLIKDKVLTTAKGTSYPIEGMSRDGQWVRVVVSPHGENLVVVTVIDLRKEWPCTCY